VPYGERPVTECAHDELTQISTITAETTWSREPGGYHTPDEAISKVLGEETEWFECADCGERVEPDIAR
jgi:hypothetical protein